MPMSVATLQDRIKLAWESRSIKMDWLGLETLIRDVYDLENVSSDFKLELIRDALAAYTKRG